jgi:hypothetical protein
MLDLVKELIDHLQLEVTSKQWRLMLFKVGFGTSPSSAATSATHTESSRHLHHGVESTAPRLQLRQRVVSRVSDVHKWGLKGQYAVGKASEIVVLGGVGLVNCSVEVDDCLAADSCNIGIGCIWGCASSSLEIMDQAIIVICSRNRPAEAFAFDASD